MKHRFQKAMFIAWLFLLLINSGCSKKKYTYFFDRYHTTSPKGDTIIKEQPPVVFASADTTAVAIAIEERPRSIPAKKIVEHKRDSVPTPAQIKQKNRRPAAFLGVASVLSSIAAGFVFYSGVPWAILFFGGIILCLLGLKSDFRKLAKAGLWLAGSFVVLFLLFMLVSSSAGNLFPQT